VLRAEDRADGRSVALRVLPAAIVARDGAGLAADLKAAAQVSHPNGVKVLGYLEHEGSRCVVTEFVGGARTMAEAIRKGNRMTPQQAHSVFRVLAQYLGVVHAKGLVHGSVQPSNVMVASGVIKVADLGLGRLAHAQRAELDYRAPERALDVAGDLYAAAAVVYHLLTGVHPRTQPQGAALPLPSTLATGVSEAFDKLLIRCLHPRVDLRLGTADAVLAELKDMMRLA
jgi:serine/threonine-protein kinase